jgi:hypothetical protein
MASTWLSNEDGIITTAAECRYNVYQCLVIQLCQLIGRAPRREQLRFEI